MDAQSQEILNQILLKDETELTPTDISFLRARQSYLTKSQRKDYSSVLRQEAATQEARPVAPEQPKQPEQPVDKDERLNLDTAQPETPVGASGEQQAAVGGGNAEQEEDDEDEQVEEEFKDEDADAEKEPCLDPDCTHDNHQ